MTSLLEDRGKRVTIFINFLVKRIPQKSEIERQTALELPYHVGPRGYAMTEYPGLLMRSQTQDGVVLSAVR
jgi:hypothetical protein